MSDQSLRDALEKLPSTWDAVPMHVIRELLAAHPVEPAGVSDEPACDCGRQPPAKHTSACMWGRWHLIKEAGLLPERSAGVSDEVVEVAAHAMYADNEVGEWEDGNLDTLLQYRRAARIALEAAQPFMQPQVVASRAQIEGVIRSAWDIECYPEEITDALLAAGVFREPPTREQVIEALAKAEGRNPDGKSEAWQRMAEETFGFRADAVLNILGGAS